MTKRKTTTVEPEVMDSGESKSAQPQPVDDLLSTRVLSGAIPQPNPDDEAPTVQSDAMGQLIGIRSLWHSKLVVPETITIAGEIVTLTQPYTFEIGERKMIGADLDVQDAYKLINKTATTGGCCGSAYQVLNVFEGIWSDA